MSQNYLEELFGAKDCVAVITGGGTGLGFWMAEDWVKPVDASGYPAGARTRSLQDACAKLNALSPHSANYVAADLSRKAGIADMCAAVSTRETTVHALVSNAGTTALDPSTLPTQSAAEMGAALAGYDRTAWEHTYVLSNWAAGMLTGAFLPLLAAAAARGDGRGSVLNIASTAATVWNPYWPNQSYQTSKAALIALTRILAAKLAVHGVRVNSIQPGSCPSAMNPAEDPGMPTHADNVRHIPLGRAGNADDIGGAFVYLAGKAGAYVTGVDYAVDGGALPVLNSAYAPW